MCARHLFSWLAVLCLLPLTLWAADEPALKSGPEVGKDLPGPFHPYNVTGKEAGNFHCVICTTDADSVVLVFIRGSELKDDVKRLLGALDEAVAKDAKARISAAAIFLFDDLKNVVTEDVNRKKYAEQVEALKNDVKRNQVVLCLDSADSPKDYKLNPEAKVTVLICSKLKVAANFASKDEKNVNTEAIVAAVKEKVGSGAKK